MYSILFRDTLLRDSQKLFSLVGSSVCFSYTSTLVHTMESTDAIRLRRLHRFDGLHTDSESMDGSTKYCGICSRVTALNQNRSFLLRLSLKYTSYWKTKLENWVTRVHIGRNQSPSARNEQRYTVISIHPKSLCPPSRVTPPPYLTNGQGPEKSSGDWHV